MQLHSDVVEYAKEKFGCFIKIVIALINLSSVNLHWWLVIASRDHLTDISMIRFIVILESRKNYMNILLNVGGILVMLTENQLTQIMLTGETTWESKNNLAISFAPLVHQSENDYGKLAIVGLPP